MRNGIRIPLIFSILIHLSIFLATSYHTTKKKYIIIPVELAFHSSLPPKGIQEKALKRETKDTRLIKKDDQLVIPKKNTKKDESIPKLKEVTEQKQESKPSEDNKTENKGNEKGSDVSQGQLGTQISLESVNFPFSYYTNIIVKKIGKNWQWSTAFGQIKAVVYFRIQKDGSIVDLRIENSSKDKLFDQQVLRAVELADPFPPLPIGYHEDDLGVYFEFAFKE